VTVDQRRGAKNPPGQGKVRIGGLPGEGRDLTREEQQSNEPCHVASGQV